MTPAGAPLEKGYRLGKYEVIGRISVGGMAELYLAYLGGQGGFRKFVALKRVLPSVAEQDMFMKMFLDEARITATLSHANIAQVFELAEAPDNREPVLAMFDRLRKEHSTLRHFKRFNQELVIESDPGTPPAPTPSGQPARNSPTSSSLPAVAGPTWADSRSRSCPTRACDWSRWSPRRARR
jgi:hypothetical protein